MASLLVNVVPRVSWKRAVLSAFLSHVSSLSIAEAEGHGASLCCEPETLVRSARARKSRDALTDITGERSRCKKRGERRKTRC